MLTTLLLTMALAAADDTTKDRELKIQARGPWSGARGPGGAALQTVIRDAAGAAKALGLPADGN